jgi:hypothetical protein
MEKNSIRRTCEPLAKKRNRFPKRPRRKSRNDNQSRRLAATGKAELADEDDLENLTLRQKKLRTGPKSQEEQDFYKFGPLWDILQTEGWSWEDAKGTGQGRLQTWWYVAPDGPAQRELRILGTHYFTSVDAVVQYCKDQNYFAKYGESKDDGIVDKAPQGNVTTERSDHHQPVVQSNNDTSSMRQNQQAFVNKADTKRYPTEFVTTPTHRLFYTYNKDETRRMQTNPTRQESVNETTLGEDDDCNEYFI